MYVTDTSNSKVRANLGVYCLRNTAEIILAIYLSAPDAVNRWRSWNAYTFLITNTFLKNRIKTHTMSQLLFYEQLWNAINSIKKKREKKKKKKKE